MLLYIYVEDCLVISIEKIHMNLHVENTMELPVIKKSVRTANLTNDNMQ